MSYELMIDGRLAGQCGTNLGYYNTYKWCKTRGDECHHFFEEGTSKRPRELRRELQAALPEAPAGVRDVISALIEMLAKAPEDAEVSPVQ